MPIVTIEDEDGTTNEIEVPTDALQFQEGELEEVENEDLPDGIVTQGSIDAAINNRLPRAYRRALESVGLDPSEFKDEDGNYDLDQLDADTTFERLAEQKGIELREDGKPKGALKDEEVEDLKEKARRYEDIKEEYEELQKRTREQKIDTAWEAFKEEAPPMREGAEEVLKKDFEDRVEIEDGEVRVLDGDGTVMKDEVHDPMGPEALAETLPEERGFAFQSTEMGGGPADDPGASQPSGDTLTKEQYEEERQEAFQQGDKERLRELRQKAADGLIEE